MCTHTLSLFPSFSPPCTCVLPCIWMLCVTNNVTHWFLWNYTWLFIRNAFHLQSLTSMSLFVLFHALARRSAIEWDRIGVWLYGVYKVLMRFENFVVCVCVEWKKKENCQNVMQQQLSALLTQPDAKFHRCVSSSMRYRCNECSQRTQAKLNRIAWTTVGDIYWRLCLEVDFDEYHPGFHLFWRKFITSKYWTCSDAKQMPFTYRV